MKKFSISLAISISFLMLFITIFPILIFADTKQTQVSISDIQLDNTNVTLLPGTTTELTANVSPKTTDRKQLQWSSLDSSIAAVDSKGTITAKSLGQTYIIVSSPDAKIQKACKVVVSDSQMTEVQNAAVTCSGGNGSLTISWEDAKEPSVKKVKIYRYDPTYHYDPLYATATYETTVSRGTKNHTFNGLTNGEIYNYILRGVRADGSETLGIRVCGIPGSKNLLEGMEFIGITENGSEKNIEMLESFFSGEVSYTAFVTSDVVSVKAIPHIKDSSNLKIIVNGNLVENGQESPVMNLSQGALTDFGITVITKDNTYYRSYIPVIYRQNKTDAFLKSLEVSKADEINQNFKPRSFDYISTYNYYTDKVVITPTALENQNAAITINGSTVESGVPTVVNLSEGINNIQVKVTSLSNSQATKTYHLSLTRHSSNDLENLSVSNGSEIRSFDPENSKYYVDVKNDVKEVSITPTAYGSNSSITVNGTDVKNGQASNKIQLNVGDNLIKVKVNNAKTYSVYVYRLPQNDYLFSREEGDTITLRNKYISATFNNTNSDMILMNQPGGQDVIGDGRGYFLAVPSYKDTASNKTNSLVYGFNKNNIVRSISYPDEDTIDLSYTSNDASTGPIRYVLHYVMNKNEPGIYTYVTCNYDSTMEVSGKTNWSPGQVRWSVRGDETKFNKAHYQRGVFPLISPHHVDGTSVSDCTWLLPNGKIHGKYDLVEYEDHKLYGMTGDRYGIWFIKAADDYTDGMPTAQELAVHETNTTPIINWAPNASHYGRTVETVSDGYQYMWGPIFVYLNDNKNENARWQDASAVTDNQINEWPYSFIKNTLYDVDSRGTVTGNIKVTEGASCEGTTVILSNPDKNWEQQSTQYTYSAKADKDGNFAIENVRAGTYRVYAFQTGIYTNYTSPDVVEIKANTNNEIGSFVWDTKTFGEKIWEIGVADRTGKEYLHGSTRQFGAYRTYPFEFPNEVDFTIGESHENTDWLYGQVPSTAFGSKALLLTDGPDNPSVWKIRFHLDSLPKGSEGKLTIAIAASRAPSLKVHLNDTVIQNYGYGTIEGNDSAYVRSGYQGIYKLLEIPFDTSLLKVGENVVKLDSNRTMFNSDGQRITDIGAAIIYDAIKMELSDTDES